MIHSKFNHNHRYESIDPIFNANTGVFSGDVMATRIINEKPTKIHIKLMDLEATTEEDQQKLDQLKDTKMEGNEEDNE